MAAEWPPLPTESLLELRDLLCCQFLTSEKFRRGSQKLSLERWGRISKGRGSIGGFILPLPVLCQGLQILAQPRSGKLLVVKKNTKTHYFISSDEKVLPDEGKHFLFTILQNRFLRGCLSPASCPGSLFSRGPIVLMVSRPSSAHPRTSHSGQPTWQNIIQWPRPYLSGRQQKVHFLILRFFFFLTETIPGNTYKS